MQKHFKMDTYDIRWLQVWFYSILNKCCLKKYVHPHGTRMKIFHIFSILFFKSVPFGCTYFLRRFIMYGGTNGLKEASYKKCCLNNEYMAFYGYLYGHIANKAFFIHQKTKDFPPNYLSCKKQRIFNQIAKF